MNTSTSTTEKTEAAVAETEAAREAFVAAAAEKAEAAEKAAEAVAEDAEVESEDVDDSADEASTDDAEDAADAEWDAAVDAALDAGLTEKDIEGFDSPAALNAAAALLARSKSGDDRKASGGDTPAAADELDDDEIDWDYLDPDTSKALKAIQASHAREVAELTRKLEEVSGTIAEQSKIAAGQRFDGYVAELDKPYQKLFESAKNRSKLRDEMDVLRDGYRSRGREVPDESELFSKALHSTFSTDLKRIDADRVKRSVKARQSQMLAAPSARRAAADHEMSPDDIARERLIENFERATAS
jgi:hypothetical protein